MYYTYYTQKIYFIQAFYTIRQGSLCDLVSYWSNSDQYPALMHLDLTQYWVHETERETAPKWPVQYIRYIHARMGECIPTCIWCLEGMCECNQPSFPDLPGGHPSKWTW